MCVGHIGLRCSQAVHFIWEGVWLDGWDIGQIWMRLGQGTFWPWHPVNSGLWWKEGLFGLLEIQWAWYVPFQMVVYKSHSCYQNLSEFWKFELLAKSWQYQLDSHVCTIVDVKNTKICQNTLLEWYIIRADNSRVLHIRRIVFQVSVCLQPFWIANLFMEKLVVFYQSLEVPFV